MSDDTLLLPNLGAEEGDKSATAPAARAMAALWSLLFPAGTKWLTPGGDITPGTPWPEALGAPAAAPAFSWLEEWQGDAGVVAWLNTEQAAREAREAGRELRGPLPEVVRRVHDKAFATRASEKAGVVPRALRGLSLALDPDDLASADAAVERMQQHIRTWPGWIEGGFTLKPRIGGSGRGRVPGRDRRAETPEVRRALPRLAERGGAILEPWLQRERDLSVQLHVACDGTLTLIATIEQRLSASGVYRGHRGEVDYRARVVSGTTHDDALLEAAVALASAAHAEGFHGPCGIDAFTFEGPDGVTLRPVVELNARFTTGTVLAGLLRRAAPRIDETLGLDAGVRRPFHFGLDAGDVAGGTSNADVLILPLAEPGSGLRPTLLVGRDMDALEAHLGGDAA